MMREQEKAAQLEHRRGAECPLCASSVTHPVWRKEAARIHRCPRCGVLYVVERPAESEVAYLYDTGTLLGGQPHFSSSSDGPVPEWKRREHFELLDDLARLGVHGGRLLDVGCFGGTFLQHARQRGFDVAGVDPSYDAFRYVCEVLGLPAAHGTLRGAGFPAASFSAVSLLDVIEHVPEPVDELQEVFRILRPGGALVITTPDAAGLLQRILKVKRRMLGQEWCPIDSVPWHLWGFTRESLRLCAEKAGFVVRKTLALVPSPRSTNDGAGSVRWKRSLLRIVADLSQAVDMSDRMAILAQRPAE